ncbi:hypothetical protein OA864_01130, partial [bacterium]|nr:hypothetical protein [bacterium]
MNEVVSASSLSEINNVISTCPCQLSSGNAVIEWSSELAKTTTDSSSEEKADKMRVDPVSTSETSKEKLVGISSGIETSAACAIIGA